MNPYISIVVPVYNNEHYLSECLDSALAQTLSNIEIICVDDGSTDGSPAMLNDYAAKDQRIRVIHKPNTGFGHSLNTGIDAARGKYLGILESDDYCEPNMYDLLFQKAKEFDFPDMVRCDFCRFYGEGEGRTFDPAPLSDNNALKNVLLHPQEDLGIFSLYSLMQPGIYSLDLIRSWAFDSTKAQEHPIRTTDSGSKRIRTQKPLFTCLFRCTTFAGTTPIRPLKAQARYMPCAGNTISFARSFWLEKVTSTPTF